ncbi:MAG: hypothetical protein AAGE52_23380, partial [Myxococcota bacterium]
RACFLHEGVAHCWRAVDAPQPLEAPDVREVAISGLGVCVRLGDASVRCQYPGSDALRVVEELHGVEGLRARGSCAVGMHGGAYCHRSICGRLNERERCVDESYHGDMSTPQSTLVVGEAGESRAAQAVRPEAPPPELCFYVAAEESSRCRRFYPIHGATRMMYGRHVACGLRDNGSLACMGLNHAGQIQAPPDEGVFHETSEIGVRDIVEVAIGHQHVCALDEHGHVWCWGDAAEGQVGRDPERYRSAEGAIAPVVEVPALRDVTRIVAGGNLNCAIVADGSIRCWGGGDYRVRTVFPR